MSLLGCLTPSPRAAPQSAKARMKKPPKRSQNEKYRLKYLQLRKAAKATVFENAAICDEIARLEEKFLKAKEERRVLVFILLACSEELLINERSQVLPETYWIKNSVDGAWNLCFSKSSV
ncbi:transforming growth factor beta regulator 1-like [Artibeus jamaicensis]|uniref:transforming growth factor beta regulator 1-like n=1 Tax=Artibeus jamaicensis TaxID=9417 RepID=UPI00235B1629|nr:transforming growth factor beta regulator 1-like [Artibeus jamaicensis]